MRSWRWWRSSRCSRATLGRVGRVAFGMVLIWGGFVTGGLAGAALGMVGVLALVSGWANVCPNALALGLPLRRGSCPLPSADSAEPPSR